MCIRRTRWNMWMRWKVGHWSSNRFDASWCFPNLRHHLCKKIFASQQLISVIFGVGLYALLCQSHFDGIGFTLFATFCNKKQLIFCTILLSMLCGGPILRHGYCGFCPQRQRRRIFWTKTFLLASEKICFLKSPAYPDTYSRYFEQRCSCSPLKSFTSNERQ